MTTPRRRAIWLCREIDKLPPDERAWVLIHALTGCIPPGDDTIDDRNIALRKFSARWYAGASIDSAARAIALDITRYVSTAWKRDQHRMKPELDDERRRDLFDILKTGANPVGFEAIRKILAGTN